MPHSLHSSTNWSVVCHSLSSNIFKITFPIPLYFFCIYMVHLSWFRFCIICSFFFFLFNIHPSTCFVKCFKSFLVFLFCFLHTFYRLLFRRTKTEMDAYHDMSHQPERCRQSESRSSGVASARSGRSLRKRSWSTNTMAWKAITPNT